MSAEKEPRLGVGFLAYNEEGSVEKTVAEAVTSLSAIDGLDWRVLIVNDGSRDRTGEVLARLGAVSRFGVDFLAWRNAPHEAWRITALEINLRLVGTTHPFLALRFLTGGNLDPVSGQFLSLSGRPKHYRATDNLCSDIYRGMLPEDLIDIVSLNGLHYSHRTESGVLFYMIGAVSEFGKLGLTVIGNDRDEADAIYERTIDVLRVEATLGHLPSGFEWPAGKPATRSTAS